MAKRNPIPNSFKDEEEIQLKKRLEVSINYV